MRGRQPQNPMRSPGFAPCARSRTGWVIFSALSKSGLAHPGIMENPGTALPERRSREGASSQPRAAQPRGLVCSRAAQPRGLGLLVDLRICARPNGVDIRFVDGPWCCLDASPPSFAMQSFRGWPIQGTRLGSGIVLNVFRFGGRAWFGHAGHFRNCVPVQLVWPGQPLRRCSRGGQLWSISGRRL